MGFFARLFGGSKSTASATVLAESAPKPESEIQAAEQPVASAPEAVQSIAQDAEPPEQSTASAPEAAPAAPEVLDSEPAPPQQPIEAASTVEPEAEETEPEDEEELSEPEPAPEPFPALAPDEVIYVLTTFGVDSIDPAFMATKKVYRAGSRQAAVAFLRTQVVTETLFYIEVETPDGPFGIDLRHRVFNAQGHFVDF
ncbi:putative membrane protein [Rhodoblastus acidophilus]|uniref:hypothetical protein n=1 Tax=Rhodoblastus acidophilus TaxID=1074 RepID=UPI002224BA2E|nr:hypothetical protein [Rhodoblastus acidophilus]MCW2282820.1 putative membrane protein [Rhodoblastus acidophilus]MCW2331681.1 putative membrane protein [Rhodoblastus acidophilus]